MDEPTNAPTTALSPAVGLLAGGRRRRGRGGASFVRAVRACRRVLEHDASALGARREARHDRQQRLLWSGFSPPLTLQATQTVHQSPGLCNRAFGPQPGARQRSRSRSMIEWSEGSAAATPSRIAPSMLSLTAESNSMR